MVITLSTSAATQGDEPRRPVDLSCFGSEVVVVCERPAGLVVINCQSGAMTQRLKMDGSPVKIVKVNEHGFLILNQGSSKVERFERREGAWSKTGESACVADPIEGVLTADALYVSGRWSRQVAKYALQQAASNSFELGEPLWRTDLDFSPGALCVLQEEQRLIVADHFGSHWREVDLSTGEIVQRIRFFGHRLRGIVPDHSGNLVLTHQLLNATARTTREDIHWGITMSNDIRWLRRENIAAADARQFYHDSRIDRIGDVGSGAAEPNDLAVTHDGLIVIACGGSDEVSIGKPDEYGRPVISVGRRPVAIDLNAEETEVWVACQLDDTVWKLDVGKRVELAKIELAPPRELASPEERGESLFHDARLSHDGWMTCSSCHPDGHTVGERSDTLGDGDYGAPKRTPSLLGRADAAPFGWLGTDLELSSQVERSIRKTMNAPTQPSEQALGDLVAYLRSLRRPPSSSELTGSQDVALRERGAVVFQAASCADCHSGPLYTSTELRDVGTVDALGRKRFNPPSLVGVDQSGPTYLHDGRAGSLRAVFEEHRHPDGRNWDPNELDALLAYLRGL